MNKPVDTIDPESNLVALAKFNRLTEDFLPKGEPGAYCAVFVDDKTQEVHMGAKINVRKQGLMRLIAGLVRAAETLGTKHGLPIKVRVEHS